MRFQNALYGKFFGKPPPFQQVKMFLTAKWPKIGEVLIFNLSNGFLLIRSYAVFALNWSLVY